MSYSIFLNFPVSNEEYQVLENEFKKLAFYAAHQLKKKNSSNNVVEDIEDITQELSVALYSAGCYYKRQVFIEKCLTSCKTFVQDAFKQAILTELETLWKNRTRHGANRRKFGEYQEHLLEKLVKDVPSKLRPEKNDRLNVDAKFATYCKAIVWNKQKNMGKKITKEKSIRQGCTSLSEHLWIT